MSSKKAGRVAVGGALLLSVVLVMASSALANHIVLSPGGQPTHWSDRAGTVPVVFVVDRTSAAWPVFASAAEWNKNNSLTVTYQAPGSCTFHCMDVREATDLGACSGSFVAGVTIFDRSTLGHMTSSTRIKFNANCNSKTSGFRRETACHELGHGVGALNERALSADTCMRQGFTSVFKLVPDSHDFSMFTSPLYNHND